MSYVVSIRRSGSETISAAELRALIAKDSTLRESPPVGTVGEHDTCDLEWRADASSSPVLFVFQSGEVSVTTPSHAALRKMQELALLLGATVIGEEGEDLTTVQVPEWEFSSTGLWGCAIAVVAFAGVLWWWLWS